MLAAAITIDPTKVRASRHRRYWHDYQRDVSLRYRWLPGDSGWYLKYNEFEPTLNSTLTRYHVVISICQYDPCVPCYSLYLIPLVRIMNLNSLTVCPVWEREREREREIWLIIEDKLYLKYYRESNIISFLYYKLLLCSHSVISFIFFFWFGNLF